MNDGAIAVHDNPDPVADGGKIGTRGRIVAKAAAHFCPAIEVPRDAICATFFGNDARNRHVFSAATIGSSRLRI
jgi:hypothetical protein